MRYGCKSWANANLYLCGKKRSKKLCCSFIRFGFGFDGMKTIFMALLLTPDCKITFAFLLSSYFVTISFRNELKDDFDHKHEFVMLSFIFPRQILK